MAKARIKLGRLLFRDYAKYDYGTGTYPTVTRRWSNIPLDAAYDMEKKKHPDYEVFYDPDEIPYSKMIKQEEIDDIEIDKILKGDISGDKVDEPPPVPCAIVPPGPIDS